jgi:hypothetical protein
VLVYGAVCTILMSSTHTSTRGDCSSLRHSYSHVTSKGVGVSNQTDGRLSYNIIIGKSFNTGSPRDPNGIKLKKLYGDINRISPHLIWVTIMRNQNPFFILQAQQSTKLSLLHRKMQNTS